MKTKLKTTLALFAAFCGLQLFTATPAMASIPSYGYNTSIADGSFTSSNYLPKDSTVKVFDGITLNDIKTGNFSARFGGESVGITLDSKTTVKVSRTLVAAGYHVTETADGLTVQFQVLDSTYVKCAKVLFSNGTGGVYAKVLTNSYKSGGSLGDDADQYTSTSTPYGSDSTSGAYGIAAISVGPSLKYQNKLAGSVVLPADTYGSITVGGGGIQATSFASGTVLGSSGSGISGSYSSLIITGVNYDSHTVAGWFKVDSLPSSGNKQIWGAANGDGNLRGYAIVVDSTGKIGVNQATSASSGTSITFTGTNYFSTNAVIEGNKWYHLAISIVRDGSRKATVRLFVNGVDKGLISKNNAETGCNGGASCTYFSIGAGVSAAGLYIDNGALVNTDLIKSIATNEDYVAPIVTGAARIGSTGYETVAAAFAAVQDGQTVVLLQACTETLTAPAKTFTLNLGGFAMSGSLATVENGSITLVYSGDTFTSPVTGGGTIVMPNNTLPTGNFKTSLAAAATWTGTLWIKNKTSWNAWDMESYGNANSKIKLTGVTGYAPSSSKTCSSEIILEDEGTTKALTIANGWSSTTYAYTIAKLSGSGTWTRSHDAAQNYNILDISGFTGTFALGDAGPVINIGTGTHSVSRGNGSIIYIDSGYAATIASGKTWTVKNGIFVNGTLTNNGTITGTVKGSGTLVYSGVSSAPTAPTGLTASDWTGTVWFKNANVGGWDFSNYCNDASKVKFTGVKGWLKNTGTDNVCPQGIAELVLENDGDTLAFEMTDSSENRAYTFTKFTGSGTFKCATSSDKACAVAVADVSDFTGKLISAAGTSANPRPIYIADTVTSAIAGTAALINVAAGEAIVANAGWEAAAVEFGATLTVKGNVNDVIVSGVTTAPTLNTTVTLLDPTTGSQVAGSYKLEYDSVNHQVKVVDAIVYLGWNGTAWTNGVGTVVTTITTDHVLVAKDGDNITFGAATTPGSFNMPETGTVTITGQNNLTVTAIDIPTGATLAIASNAAPGFGVTGSGTFAYGAGSQVEATEVTAAQLTGFTGTFSITSGRHEYNAALPDAVKLRVSDGAQFYLTGGTWNNAFEVSGRGWKTSGNDVELAAIRMDGATLSTSGSIAFSVVNEKIPTLGSTGTGTINGTLTGVGFEQHGNGTIVLGKPISQASTLTSNIVVMNGTLKIGNGNNSGCSAGSEVTIGTGITVNSGAAVAAWCWTTAAQSASTTDKIKIMTPITLNDGAQLNGPDGAHAFMGAVTVSANSTASGTFSYHKGWAFNNLIIPAGSTFNATCQADGSYNVYFSVLGGNVDGTLSVTNNGGDNKEMRVCVAGDALADGTLNIQNNGGNGAFIFVVGDATLGTVTGNALAAFGDGTSRTLTLTGGTYDINFKNVAGGLGESGKLNLVIAGNVTLNGNNTANVCSGTVMVNSGATLTLGNASVLPTGKVTVTGSLNLGAYRPTNVIATASTGTINLQLTSEEDEKYLAATTFDILKFDAAGTFGGTINVFGADGTTLRKPTLTIVDDGSGNFVLRVVNNNPVAADFPITANVTALDPYWDNLAWTNGQGVAYTKGFCGKDLTAGSVILTNAYGEGDAVVSTLDLVSYGRYDFNFATLKTVNKQQHKLTIYDGIREYAGTEANYGTITATTIDDSESTGATKFTYDFNVGSVTAGADTILDGVGTVGTLTVNAGKKATITTNALAVTTYAGQAGGTVRFEGARTAACYSSITGATNSYQNANIVIPNGGSHAGLDVVGYVGAGDYLRIYGANNDTANAIGWSFVNNGGTLVLATNAVNQSTWCGRGGRTFRQIAGTTTVESCNDTATASKSYSNFMLNYQGSGTTTLSVEGGEFLVPDTALRFGCDNAAAITVSGGLLKVKGVRKYNDTATVGGTITVSGGKFSIGGIGMAANIATLTLSGGEFNAFEDSTVANAITLGADSTISAAAGKTMTVSGALSGSGALTIGTAEDTGAVKFTNAISDRAVTFGGGLLDVAGTTSTGVTFTGSGTITNSADTAASINGLPIAAGASRTVTDGKIMITVAADETLTLSSVPAANTVVITGAGRVVLTGTTIPELPAGLWAAGEDGWKGTFVWGEGFSGNKTGWDLTNYYNGTYSKFEFNGTLASGNDNYFRQEHWQLGGLILNGSITFRNGYSRQSDNATPTVYRFKSLSGTGTIAATGSVFAMLRFDDADAFTGSISLTAYRVTVGSGDITITASGTPYPATGSITFVGGTADLNANALTAGGGVCVTNATVKFHKANVTESALNVQAGGTLDLSAMDAASAWLTPGATTFAEGSVIVVPPAVALEASTYTVISGSGNVTGTSNVTFKNGDTALTGTTVGGEGTQTLTLTTTTSSRMYFNRLGGGVMIPATTYGEITLGRKSLATAYDTRTTLTNSASDPERGGSYADIIKKPGGDTDTATHTVAGWFKIAALPTGEEYQDLYYANSGDSNDNGYKVAVNASGKILVGKTNQWGWNTDKKDDAPGGPVSSQNDNIIAANTWYHIVVSVTKTSDKRSATPRVFINGAEIAMEIDSSTGVTKKFATNCNGTSCANFCIQSGVSAAGIYVDTTAIADAGLIKSLATNTKYLKPLTGFMATVADATPVNFSALPWVPEAEEADYAANYDWTIANATADASVTLDKAVTAGTLTFNTTAALTFAAGEGSLTATTVCDTNSTAKTTISVSTGAANVLAGADTVLTQAGSDSGAIHVANGKKATVPAWYYDHRAVSQGGYLKIMGDLGEKSMAKNSGLASNGATIDIGGTATIVNSAFESDVANTKLVISGNVVTKSGADEIKIAQDANVIFEVAEGGTFTVQSRVMPNQNTTATATINITGGTMQGAAGKGFWYVGGWYGTGASTINISAGSFTVPWEPFGNGACINTHVATVNVSGTGVFAPTVIGYGSGSYTATPDWTTDVANSKHKVNLSAGGTFKMPAGVPNWLPVNVTSGTGVLGVQDGVTTVTNRGPMTVATGAVANVGSANATVVQVGTISGAGTLVVNAGTLEFLDATKLTVSAITIKSGAILKIPATGLPLNGATVTIEDGGKIDFVTDEADPHAFHVTTGTLTVGASTVADAFLINGAPYAGSYNWHVVDGYLADDTVVGVAFSAKVAGAEVTWSTAAGLTETVGTWKDSIFSTAVITNDFGATTINFDNGIVAKSVKIVSAVGHPTTVTLGDGKAAQIQLFDITEALGGVTFGYAPVADHLALGANVTATVANGAFGSGALDVSGNKVTGPATSTLVFDMGKDGIQAFTGYAADANRHYTLKVVSGVLDFTFQCGNNGTPFRGREVIADGENAALRLDAQDATGYNNLSTGIKVYNGAQLQVQVRDTFLSPLELKAGYVVLQKGAGNSDRAFDLHGNHTWTISALDGATAENPTISYLTAVDDASNIDKAVFYRNGKWTIDVAENAKFVLNNVVLYSQGGSSQAITKTGAGELVLNNKTTSHEGKTLQAPWAINGGKVTLLDAAAFGSGTVTIGANGTVEFDMGLFANVEEDTLAFNIANDGSASRVTILNGDKYPWLSFGTEAGNLGKIVIDRTKYPVRGLHFVNFCPKPGTTAADRDPNGRTSGWIDLKNYNQTDSVNLKDYKIYRYNITKAAKPDTISNLCDYELAAGETIRVYISEDYANAEDHGGDGDNLKVEWWGTNTLGKVVRGDDPGCIAESKLMIIPQKVNPKKYPMVMLYENTTSVTNGILDQTLVPSDIDDAAIVELGANTNKIERSVVQGGVRTDYGPDVSPVYGVKGTKTDLELLNKRDGFVSANADYWLTLPINPFTEGGTPEANEIESVVIEYRDFGLNPGESQLAGTTNRVASTDAEKKTYGEGCLLWEGKIPKEFLADKAGHLIQFRARILDKGGVLWLAPRGLNKDVGHMWYGFVVQPELSVDPATGICLDKLQTFLLYVDNVSIDNMDKDISAQDPDKLQYGARVGVYDTQTHTYYDNVRIDLRGQTSSTFKKKSHGLRFSKVAPLKCTDPFEGEEIESRKTSFIAEYGDPAYIRQTLALRVMRESGIKAPFDYPVRLYLNGEFYQLAFHSNRFSDEIVEDYYGLNPNGYSYKNSKTLSATLLRDEQLHPTSSTCEKKTPDDDNETDLSVLIDFVDNIDNETDPTTLTKIAMTNFNLAAWVNYMAATKITQECDDVWTNLGIYINKYDEWNNPCGDGTMMPIAYDMNLSFGVWYFADDSGRGRCGIVATNDLMKSHPFYGGRNVLYHFNGGTTQSKFNRGMEVILQNPTYREALARRIRTLAEKYYGSDTATEAETPVWQWATNYWDAISGDVNADHTKWNYSFEQMTTLTGNVSPIWVWNYAPTFEQAKTDLWTNFIVPHRHHLFDTHAAANAGKTDYPAAGGACATGSSALIPETQAATETLGKHGALYFTDIAGKKPGETGFNLNVESGIIGIVNTNNVAIDVSDWTVEGAVIATFKPGTVIPTNSVLWVVENRQAAAEAIIASASATTTPVIVNLDKTLVDKKGKRTEKFDFTANTIQLKDADGTPAISYEATIGTKYYITLLDAFNGATAGDIVTLLTDINNQSAAAVKTSVFLYGDTNTLTGAGFNVADDATLTIASGQIANGALGASPTVGKIVLMGGKYINQDYSGIVSNQYHMAALGLVADEDPYKYQVVPGEAPADPNTEVLLPVAEIVYNTTITNDVGNLAFTTNWIVKAGLATAEQLATKEGRKSVVDKLNIHDNNHIQKWANKVLGLDGSVGTNIPVVSPQQTAPNGQIDFKLGNVTVDKSSGAIVTYQVMEADEPGAATWKEASDATIHSETIRITLPKDGVKYYKFNVITTPAK